MSNYRRLISYIYAYEGGIKGKNIGFAKIETRGSQCKITVSVKKVYVGGNDIGVYLLAGEREILLGNIFIRGGSGEFRAVVASGDVEHSGIPVDQCYGLTVHDVENTWRSYTTIWEDAVAHAAELELSNNLPDEKETKESAQEAHIQKAIREIEEEFPVDDVQELESNREHVDVKLEEVSAEQPKSFTENAREQSKAFAESIRKRVEDSAELAKQKAEAWMRQQETIEPVKTEKPPVEEPPEHIYSHEEPFSSNYNPVREPYQPQRGYSSYAGIPAVEYASELMPDIENVPVKTICYRADTASFSDSEQAPQVILTEGRSGEDRDGNEAENKAENQTENQSAAEARQESFLEQETQEAQAIREAQETKALQAPGESQAIQSPQNPQESQPVPGDPEELKRLLKEEEEEENSSEQVWEQMRRTHTKILDFDYEKGCEILTIKPQDIGLLPRETWGFGNNSFLLHGYYNYRYLILAKLFNPEGAARYLLGVPGHYYSNERYMASMFGFPNFVLSKNQPIEDGRFGYWYTDIKIGN